MGRIWEEMEEKIVARIYYMKKAIFKISKKQIYSVFKKAVLGERWKE